MKKPEKIYFKSSDSPQEKFREQRIGYNKACNDWEKFLPNKKEIREIIHIHSFRGKCLTEYAAKALAKRIGK